MTLKNEFQLVWWKEHTAVRNHKNIINYSLTLIETCSVRSVKACFHFSAKHTADTWISDGIELKSNLPEYRFVMRKYQKEL